MPVFVENRNPSFFTDRYDGIDYDFAPGEKTLLHDDAARHIFGYGDNDKSGYLSRLGKANLPNNEGVKWLSRFIFTASQLVEVKDSPKVKDVAPAVDKKQKALADKPERDDISDEELLTNMPVFTENKRMPPAA